MGKNMGRTLFVPRPDFFEILMQRGRGQRLRRVRQLPMARAGNGSPDEDENNGQQNMIDHIRRQAHPKSGGRLGAAHGGGHGRIQARQLVVQFRVAVRRRPYRQIAAPDFGHGGNAAVANPAFQLRQRRRSIFDAIASDDFVLDVHFCQQWPVI